MSGSVKGSKWSPMSNVVVLVLEKCVTNIMMCNHSFGAMSPVNVSILRFLYISRLDDHDLVTYCANVL